MSVFFLGVISLHRKFLFLWQLICTVINDPVKMGRNEFLGILCGLLRCIFVNNVSEVCYKEWQKIKEKICTDPRAHAREAPFLAYNPSNFRWSRFDYVQLLIWLILQQSELTGAIPSF